MSVKLSTDELSKLLEQFDYRKQNTLPDELLTGIKAGKCITYTKNDGKVVLSQKELTYTNETLIKELVTKHSYTPSSKIIELYLPDAGPVNNCIYYALVTGERLGDD